MKNIKEVNDVAKMNVEGQVTIPNAIRKFYLTGSKFVGFKIVPEGILLVPLEVKEKEPYTAEEWKKIEGLAEKKGKIYKTSKELRMHLDSL